MGQIIQYFGPNFGANHSIFWGKLWGTSVLGQILMQIIEYVGANFGANHPLFWAHTTKTKDSAAKEHTRGHQQLYKQKKTKFWARPVLGNKGPDSTDQREIARKKIRYLPRPVELHILQSIQ